MKAAGVNPGGGRVCLQSPFLAVQVTSIGAANLANDSDHHVSLSFNFDVRPRPGFGLLLGWAAPCRNVPVAYCSTLLSIVGSDVWDRFVVRCTMYGVQWSSGEVKKMTQMMTFDEENKTAVVPIPVVRLVAPPNLSATLVGMRWTTQCTTSKNQELSVIRYDIKLAQCLAMIGNGDADVVDETKETEVGKRV